MQKWKRQFLTLHMIALGSYALSSKNNNKWISFWSQFVFDLIFHIYFFCLTTFCTDIFVRPYVKRAVQLKVSEQEVKRINEYVAIIHYLVMVEVHEFSTFHSKQVDCKTGFGCLFYQSMVNEILFLVIPHKWNSLTKKIVFHEYFPTKLDTFTRTHTIQIMHSKKYLLLSV